MERRLPSEVFFDYTHRQIFIKHFVLACCKPPEPLDSIVSIVRARKEITAPFRPLQHPHLLCCKYLKANKLPADFHRVAEDAPTA